MSALLLKTGGLAAARPSPGASSSASSASSTSSDVAKYGGSRGVRQGTPQKRSSPPAQPFSLGTMPPNGPLHVVRPARALHSSPVLVSAVKDALEGVLQVPEASSIIAENKTKDLVNLYSSLIPDDRSLFIRTLASDYGINHANVIGCANNLTAAHTRSPSSTLRAEERLRQALIPRYQTLFTQISKLENGVKFLVDLRADCIKMLLMPSVDQDSSYLQAMNICLRDLLSLWFSVGFLALERITWESPCDMLQKISDYEAVHPIRNWTDLKRRVGPYRRCFVFTHGSMPRQPVVVLHTALTTSISSSIQDIVQNTILSPSLPTDVSSDVKPSLDADIKEDPEQISTAIFYSITSTQKGLHGVELGNYLIKSVVRELTQEFPKMSQFSSLSPIPGFKEWLVGEISKLVHITKIGEEAGSSSLFLPSETQAIADGIGVYPDRMLECLKRELNNNNWMKEAAIVQALEGPLMRLCARYLYLEKRRGFALNPVANFHLRNGAVMWRLNWLADRTPRGLGASCGIMVNYRYYLDNTEENSKVYMENQRIVASEQITALIMKCIPETGQAS